MKRKSTIAFVLAASFVLALGNGWAQSYQFSGRVYDGAVGVEATPISGVTVTLYGSNSSGSTGTVITTATTDATGWYGLSAIRTSYDYYNIVETDPSGYNSAGATTVSGTVVNSNQIQYSGSLSGKTLTGNKFWDQKPQASNNPPVAEAGGPYSGSSAGAPVSLDGSSSYDPDTGDYIVQYDWQATYPNGTNASIYSGSAGTLTWVAPLAGVYTITLTVTDTHGAQDTDTAELTIGDGSRGTGVISGMKFNDQNGNHQKDAGEPGLGGWQIYYSGGSVGGYETTAPDGSYSINHLPADAYRVYETPQTGWTQTYPSSGSYTITLTEGQAVGDVDFGNTQSAQQGNLDYGDAPLPYPEAADSLGGPWLGNLIDTPDAESGMQRDAHALGDNNSGSNDEKQVLFLDGPTVGGAAVLEIRMSLPTNCKGYVSFGIWIDYNQDGDWDESNEILLPGFCTVDVSATPSLFNSPVYMIGIVPSNAKPGKTFARARVCSGHFPNFSPNGSGTAGEVEDYEVEVQSGGAPLPPGGIIAGVKFNDLNGNGKVDAGEPNLANWPIWLDMNGNGILDPGEPQTATNSTGIFMFTGLADGAYNVFETMQTGWVQTLPGSPAAAMPYTVILKNGRLDPFVSILFGNRQTSTPGTGTGAVKWFQPALFDPNRFEEKFYLGWGEPSMDGAATLADDWFCYNKRPVTSIIWWGTYADWDALVPPPDAPAKFRIGLWTDSPADNDKPWDRPDRMIREWIVDRSGLNETRDRKRLMPEWMNSLPDTCFRYTFPIPAPDRFQQQGDSAVYWLSIAAVYNEPPKEHVWGWLTRERYFRGDAVRIYAPAAPHPDSLFRIGEPVQPQTWDLAFVLGTDQNTALYDFGDAPDGYGTTWSHNGAVHLVRPDVRLGQAEDAEDDGVPDLPALADDRTGSDDEDGVTFLGDFVPGEMAHAAVTVSARGYLSAWLDLNRNGKWDGPEDVLRNMEVNAGSRVVDFPVADDAVPGKSVMRFRFSTRPDAWVKGFAPDGEVEDYAVDIQRSATGVEEGRDGIRPGRFRLYPNYPNPFNPNTTIRFDLPKAGTVRLAIYDVLGREIAVLVNEKRREGTYEAVWDGRDARQATVPSGVYLYRLEAAPNRAIGKLLLLK
jgi:hypothetical protein